MSVGLGGRATNRPPPPKLNLLLPRKKEKTRIRQGGWKKEGERRK